MRPGNYELLELVRCFRGSGWMVRRIGFRMGTRSARGSGRPALNPREAIGTLDLHEARALQEDGEGGPGREISFHTVRAHTLEERCIVEKLDTRGLLQELQGCNEIAGSDIEVLLGRRVRRGHPGQRNEQETHDELHQSRSANQKLEHRIASPGRARLARSLGQHDAVTAFINIDWKAAFQEPEKSLDIIQAEMPPDANPRNAGILDEHFLMGVSVELGDRFDK